MKRPQLLGPKVATPLPSLMVAVLCFFANATVAADAVAIKSKPLADTPPKPAQNFSYLRPCTPEVGGVRNLCLIYHGREKRKKWTDEALLPYVAYLDENGRPKDWLFDSFLFLEFATDAGVSLYHDPQKGTKPALADWQWLADCWFRKDSGLTGLQRAVVRAGCAMDDPRHKANVVICVPLPQKSVTQFGPLPGQNEPLDFSREKDRRQALRWYIDRVAGQYNKNGYSRLQLKGFYWTQESIPKSDYAMVQWLCGYLHDAGYKFYWIPYYHGAGFDDWRRLGFDAAMLQPNHFFDKNSKPARLAETARRASRAGSGIEMEFDGRVISSDLFRGHYYDYLNAGVEFGWMTNSVLGWYEGGGTISMFLKDPAVGRKYYDDLYRFIKGTYLPEKRQ